MTFDEIDLGTPDYRAALRLRQAVLRAPLGLQFTTEELAEETACLHIGAFNRGAVVAVLLLKPLGSATMKMRQVAVDPTLRGQGIGSQLVAYAETFAEGRGCKTLVAHARHSALGFYRKLGYSVSGEPFVEATIAHQLVIKHL